MTKRQKEFLKEIEEKYSEEGNLFPKPMKHKDFRDYIMKYFLGEGWRTVNPINDEQVNVEALIDIISVFKVRNCQVFKPSLWF